MYHCIPYETPITMCVLLDVFGKSDSVSDLEDFVSDK